MDTPPRPPRRPGGRPDRPNRRGPGDGPGGRGPRPGNRRGGPRGPQPGQLPAGDAIDPVIGTLGPSGGEVVETTIERIVPGGDGIAHATGLTLFVPMTAPGDTAKVRIDRRRGQVAWGTVTELVTPGEGRAEPPCKFYGTCGGCDLQHLTYERQLAAKLDIVRDCLGRIGRMEAPAGLEIIPSPDPLGYRHVAEWAIDSANRRVGYRVRGTHDVLDVDHCPILTGPLNGVLADLRERQAMGLLPPNNDEVRALDGDPSPGISPAIGSGFPPSLTMRVLDETYHYDATCFFQANGLLLDQLVAEALWQADPGAASDPDAPLAGDGPGFAVDLYAGVGLFTVPLARRYRRVVAVEGFQPATRWTRRNLSEAGLSHARVESAPVEGWLDRRSAALAGASIVVLDPPRTGMSPEAVRGLLALAPRRVTYVSCDPATQARDLRALVAAGYELVRMVALDMFPQTHHVETVAHLVRTEAADRIADEAAERLATAEATGEATAAPDGQPAP